MNAFLHSLPRFGGVEDGGYKPGLDRMRQLLGGMGNPHDAFPSIHVAGTNGKGSTASLIAAIGTASGDRVGLHTSPELTHVTDLMRLDGTPATRDWLDGAVARHRDAIEAVDATFFEATVALSFLYFAEQEVDVAVVEVGLGGRLDATNVLAPRLSIITSIDLEHTNLLGDTLGAIAREKAGIIKPETPVLTAVTQDDALAAIRAVADSCGAPLHRADRECGWRVSEAGLRGTRMHLRTPHAHYDDLHVALPGQHQQKNAVLAVRAAELALPNATSDAIATGLRDVHRLAGLRGRLQMLHEDPVVVADVAHNPSSLGATLGTVIPNVDGRLVVALSLATDKDLSAIAEILARHAAQVVPLYVDSPRARPAADLARQLRAHGVDTAATATVRDAVDRFLTRAAPPDALLLTGSHTVVAPALTLFDTSDHA